MIDSIKITIPFFLGHLDNCELRGCLNGKRKLRLYNDKVENGTYLRISLNDKTKSMIIEGSLRKWYLGKMSLQDLNSKTFKKVILKLSKLLGMSPAEFCDCKITQCEIGLNIKVRVSCDKIIPKISQYSHLRRYEYAGETVGFLGSNKTLKLYNKCKELSIKNPYLLDKSKVKAFAKLENKGNYYLRIELTLFDKQSFDQHSLGFIRTIGDIASNYSVLYEFWTKQVDKIIMSNIVIFDDKMTPIEYLISLGVQSLGLNEFIKEYQNKFKSKTDKGLIKAKSNANKQVLDILKRFESREEYNKNNLRADIVKALIRINRKEEFDHLPVLIRNLWGRANDTKSLNANSAINIEK